jgi:hypothetical protein
VAMPAAAPVRISVIQAPSAMASGHAVSGSLKMI